MGFRKLSQDGPTAPQQPFSRGRCSGRKSFAPLEEPGEFGAGDVTSLPQCRGDAAACASTEGRARAFIKTFDSAGSSARCPHAGRARELPLEMGEHRETEA